MNKLLIILMILGIMVCSDASSFAQETYPISPKTRQDLVTLSFDINSYKEELLSLHERCRVDQKAGLYEIAQDLNLTNELIRALIKILDVEGLHGIKKQFNYLAVKEIEDYIGSTIVTLNSIFDSLGDRSLVTQDALMTSYFGKAKERIRKTRRLFEQGQRELVVYKEGL
jgi:hypothetical protein